MDISSLRNSIAETLLKSSGGTLENLRDDEKVKGAASFFYEALPLPIKLGVKVTVGEEGVQKLALQVRDVLLSDQVASAAAFAKLTAGNLAGQGMNSIQKLGQSFSSNENQAASQHPPHTSEPAAATNLIGSSGAGQS
jgi:hypothetical protein